MIVLLTLLHQVDLSTTESTSHWGVYYELVYRVLRITEYRLPSSICLVLLPCMMSIRVIV